MKKTSNDNPQTEKSQQLNNLKKLIDIYFVMMYSVHRKGVNKMGRTSTRDIALTHTPTTRNITIPSEAVKDMGIKDDKRVQTVYDYETKTLTITKIKEN